MFEKLAAATFLICTFLAGLILALFHHGQALPTERALPIQQTLPAEQTLPPQQVHFAGNMPVNIVARKGNTGVVAMGGGMFNGWVDPFEKTDVPTMVQSSDLIVVGRIKHQSTSNYRDIMRALNSPSDRLAQLPISELKDVVTNVITVDRVLKGNLPGTTRSLKVHDLYWSSAIKVDKEHGIRFIRDPKITYGAAQLTYGIFFLKAAEAGSYDFVNQEHIVMPASPVITADTESLEPLIAVIKEMVQVFITPLNILTEKGGALGEESGVGSSGEYRISRGEVLCKDAAIVLKRAPKEIAGPMLREVASTSSDLFSKLWAVRCLASIGDFSFLESVKPIMLNPPHNLEYVSRSILQDILYNIQNPILAGIETPYSVPHLGYLLQSADVQICRDTASILRYRGTAQDVPEMTAWGSQNNDEMVRTASVAGLARITNFSEEFWREKSAAALALFKNPDVLKPFSTELYQGKTFDEKRFTALLNSRLEPARSDWYKIPKWVGEVEDFSGLVKVPTRDGWWLRDDLNAVMMGHWKWRGSGGGGRTETVWYEYQRAYEPHVDGNRYTQKVSTVGFTLAKEGWHDVREKFSMGDLASAKVVDVWQMDDEQTYEKRSEKTAQRTGVTRFFGADGKPRATVPTTGVPAGATLSDLAIKPIAPKIIERALNEGDPVHQLEDFLSRRKAQDELNKVRTATAELRAQIAGLPEELLDSLPDEQRDIPDGALIHLSPAENLEQIKDLQLPRKGGFFVMYQNGLPATLNACISLAYSGNPNAEYGVGWIYRKGTEQTVRSPKLAVHWYKKAAHHGCVPAQDELGWMYEDGQLLARDYAEARRWYQLAAGKNDAVAEYDLGQLYEKGLGVTRDYDKAMSLYEKSYAHKMNYSLFAIEKLWASNRAKPSANFRNGVSSAFDFVMKYGAPEDQIHLGEVYESGNGVTRDVDKAMALCTKAGSSGDEWARVQLRHMRNKTGK